MVCSVLSWNILGPETRDVEDYGFIKGDYGRLGKHLDIIRQYEADVLCFQEVDLTTLHFFNNFLLGEYNQLAYHDKGAHGGIVVYAKKSKFELIEPIGALLKSTEVRAPGAFCGAIIKSIQDGSQLFVGSIHVSKSSKQEAISDGIEQISDLCLRLGKNLPSKIILAGDFNTMYDDMKQTIVPLMQQKLDKEIVMFEHETCTSYSSSGELSSIDHVLYAGFTLDFSQSCVITSKYRHVHASQLEKTYEHGREHIVQPEIPSDHAPVFTVFK